MSWVSSIWSRVRDRLRRDASAPQEPLPRMLGHFRVEARLGSGGSGTVYRCYDPHRDRTVAVKRLHPALLTSEGARRRFLHEGRVARAIRHDHVIATYAVLGRETPPLLVMEYLTGGSLADAIGACAPLPLEEVIHLGVDVARGLGAIHARDLVHTDLKPANVLIDDTTGRLKVGDLGLARVIASHGRATRAFPPVGTPSYMSPEQAQGFPLGPRSDLFSLGAVLYAACTGAPPFPGESSVAVLRDLLGSTPQPLTERRADIPDGLAGLVRELLSKTPAFRPRSAEEVAVRLQGLGPRCAPKSCVFRAAPPGRGEGAPP